MGPNVRFGSKADMCAATGHVRFTPNSDRESGHQIPSLRNGARRRTATLCRGIPDDGILDVWRGAVAHYQARPAQSEGRVIHLMSAFFSLHRFAVVDSG